MLQHSPILTPVIILVLWTFVMMTWMAISRFSVFPKLKIKPKDGQRTSELALKMPAKTQWKADNYNHLLEQPTLFYATAIILALVGGDSGLNLSLAWAYVCGRILHSLVQATVNNVLVRLTLFFLTSIALFIMTINAAILLIG
ncbi:Uncharacterised protein [Zhongshania aliphaticivorans]|uniref:MAPEG family protein n=1 Tax=Zhongshania aliphaticivorans TaxID=1470434 RepID=A0A5S9NAZ6_9GAMM|nr:MAPEG family protein [Zhongshania aliphaticivorans]CAA0078826.1 Uncharacterised protein [Zhongshania aliphaticivorans]CAA0086409.1 Uncharacterised protein [Zhongshania aliphaticivorans]